MRICLCQVNPTVGDVDANAQLVLDAARRAAAAGADLAVFPEQVLSGYPAEDLWLKPHFIARCAAALERLAPELPIAVVLGHPAPTGRTDGRTANAASVVVDGAVVATYAKQELPNYAVFDEHRWFVPGTDPVVVDIPVAGSGAVPVGVTICEDGWVQHGPTVAARDAGAQVVVNLSASPWRLGRAHDREQVVRDRALESGVWVALVNQVGGQDELVFDGHSLVAGPDGTITARGLQFEEELLHVEVATEAQPHATDMATIVDEHAEVWAGLRLGLRDYVHKNGFESVVLGLSGGIDSALVLALAVDALGADRVHAATMPSRYSSGGTLGDAHAQASRLGVVLHELAIEPLVAAFDATLADVFEGRSADVTEENLQARIRGTLLMALSNKFGHLVLATGNKSEYSVGYATLYGDMNGGFAPLKDVPKTRVFGLARWRNDLARLAGEDEVIPTSVIARPPSAELRAEQRDSDSLPDYDLLDALLELLVDHATGVDDAIAAGYDAALVRRVQGMLDRAEYKRRQAPPGVRISSTAFGRDRRVPITNRFDGRRVPTPVP